jgi:hypothetical protein
MRRVLNIHIFSIAKTLEISIPKVKEAEPLIEL